MDYSKKCILTPTYSGHFQYLKNYLSSFRKNVTDKDKCVIYFIINADENKKLQKIVRKYPDLDIQILFFEDILSKFGIELSPVYLLEKYGKFSFQALKKFYGMLYLEEYKHFLVLDTESMWINKTNMADMFQRFFSAPFIVYSNTEKRLSSSEGNLRASENINFILKSHCDKWFVEQFMRFWDINILKSILKKYGSCFDIIENIYEFEKNKSLKMGLFESVLYDQYVYENIENYQKYDLDKELSENMSESAKDTYIKRFYRRFNGASGLTEHFAIFLNNENINSFVNIYQKLHIDILRVDDPHFKNMYNEIVFLKKMKPKILTCSQNHFYIDIYDLFRLYSEKKIKKIKEQFSIFLFPLKWALSPLIIIGYFIVILFKLLYISTIR